MATAKPAEALWQDYLFLTREMAKFLVRRDFDMFDELLAQREKLQLTIDSHEDKSYPQSEAGKKAGDIIRQEDRAIQNRLRLYMNQLNQGETVSQTYDLYGAANRIGAFMDRSR